MESRTRLLLIAGFVLLGVTFLVFLGRSSAPPPDLSANSFAEEYANADEDAVIEIEEMMLDVASQLKRQAWGGVLYHVADDYEGTPLLRDGDGAAKVVCGVTLRAGGPDPRSVDRAGFRKALDEV